FRPAAVARLRARVARCLAVAGASDLPGVGRHEPHHRTAPLRGDAIPAAAVARGGPPVADARELSRAVADGCASARRRRSLLTDRPPLALTQVVGTDASRGARP